MIESRSVKGIGGSSEIRREVSATVSIERGRSVYGRKPAAGWRN
jgi:hypothetical protein